MLICESRNYYHHSFIHHYLQCLYWANTGSLQKCIEYASPICVAYRQNVWSSINRIPIIGTNVVYCGDSFSISSTSDLESESENSTNTNIITLLPPLVVRSNVLSSSKKYSVCFPDEISKLQPRAPTIQYP